MRPSKIIPGNRFGRLTCLKRVADWKRGRPQFLCRCACGNEVIVRSGRLLSKNTRSCGCLKRQISAENCRAKAKPPGKAALTALFSRYRREAFSRGLAFKLSPLQFQKLIQQPCAYCGARPTTKTHYKTNGFIVYNGVDRKESNKGYSVRNCSTCCILCNRMKGNRNSTEFLAWVHQVVKLERHCDASKQN